MTQTTNAKGDDVRVHRMQVPLEPGEGSSTDVRKTILIADDEPIVRIVLEEILLRLGYNVLTAADGKEAYSTFSSQVNEIDLVIFDLSMPGMSGDELFEAMRELRPSIKAVLSSGFNDSETILAMRDAGLSGYLPKPYKLEQIQFELDRILQA